MTSQLRTYQSPTRRVLLLGATGTIGRATARTLATRGHDVVCLVRQSSEVDTDEAMRKLQAELGGADVRLGEAADPNSLLSAGLRGESFDAIVSCLASRTGAPMDAWAIDYQAHADALTIAKDARVSQFILLSAICVQKPRLEFQRAKLAFESLLIESGLTYSIVRPTAYFKSLSGQIDRLRQGKAFLLFGNGKLTSCKPISDNDLAAFLADCLSRPDRHNKILPVGGPGEAITPREQGELLFDLLGIPAQFRSIPIGVVRAVTSGMSGLAAILPSLAEKAEFARTAHYYATESMLVWDPVSGAYSDSATPSYGTDTLRAHYQRVIASRASVSLRDHALF
ncbi:MAG: NAD(P)H-binding protein [Pseudomonadota bacterium]